MYLRFRCHLIHEFSIPLQNDIKLANEKLTKPKYIILSECNAVPTILAYTRNCDFFGAKTAVSENTNKRPTAAVVYSICEYLPRTCYTWLHCAV